MYALSKKFCLFRKCQKSDVLFVRILDESKALSNTKLSRCIILNKKKIVLLHSFKKKNCLISSEAILTTINNLRAIYNAMKGHQFLNVLFIAL